MRYLYSVAAGHVNPLRKKSRDAVKFISEQEGFAAVHIVEDGRTLLLFDSMTDAKRARNLMNEKGIETGRNICKWLLSSDGQTIDFVE